MAQGIADYRPNLPARGGVTERALGWAALEIPSLRPPLCSEAISFQTCLKQRPLVQTGRSCQQPRAFSLQPVLEVQQTQCDRPLLVMLKREEFFLPNLSPTFATTDKNSWTKAAWFLVKNSKDI